MKGKKPRKEKYTIIDIKRGLSHTNHFICPVYSPKPHTSSSSLYGHII
jgi:hypothetical protein